MAKAAKVKRKDVSIHSRAARRATSPSINADKSLLETERPQSKNSSGYNYSAGYAGVDKKRKNKKMTRQQRLRLEKGIERAEQNSDKLLQKVEDSRSREKKVKTRNVPWEELNEKALGGGRTVSANAQSEAPAIEQEDDDNVSESKTQFNSTNASNDAEAEVEVDEVL